MRLINLTFKVLIKVLRLLIVIVTHVPIHGLGVFKDLTRCLPSPAPPSLPRWIRTFRENGMKDHRGVTPTPHPLAKPLLVMKLTICDY